MRNFEPKRIIVGTDFSDTANNALEAAKIFAARYGATLRLVFADPLVAPVTLIEAPAAFYVDDLPEVKQQLEKRLHDYVATHVPKAIQVEACLAVGAPGSSIVEAADDWNADLIVVGTHGRTGLQRALLGSVAESVLRDTSRPLLTVRTRTTEDTVPKAMHTILCPVNFSDVALDALAHAASLGAAFQARVIALHVVEPSVQGERAREFEELRQWIPADLRDRCELEELLLTGNAAEKVVAYAKEHDVDLLVIGAQHKRFHDTSVIGTTTERITRSAGCPVLTIARKRLVDRSVEEEKVGAELGMLG